MEHHTGSEDQHGQTTHMTGSRAGPPFQPTVLWVPGRPSYGHPTPALAGNLRATRAACCWRRTGDLQPLIHPRRNDGPASEASPDAVRR